MKKLLPLPAVILVAALAASPAGAATPIAGSIQAEATIAAPAPTTQGIIMRDGGICNPRWGC
jgi:hypothetical protein